MKVRVKKFITIPLLGVAVFGLVFGVLYFIHINQDPKDDQPVIQNEEKDQPTTKKDIKPLPKRIDYQPIVNSWAGSIGGKKSVLIYDVERSEILAEYMPDESYNTASLYKLFVVYEGYRRVQSGAWNGDDMAGTTGKTINQCLDLAIRESYSPCAETIWSLIGRPELDNIIASDFEIKNSTISSLISNPRDILAIMKRFYQHSEIKDAGLISQMKDSFLNQPITTYNWRQGLPSGFSRANVYNKVGWDYNPAGYWNIYHDTAIIEYPENNRHFIVVVMTNRVPFEKIRDLGTQIENAFYNS